jgi:hypothetical protein
MLDGFVSGCEPIARNAVDEPAPKTGLPMIAFEGDVQVHITGDTQTSRRFEQHSR